MIFEKVIEKLGNPIFITSEIFKNAADKDYPGVFTSKLTVCAFIRRNGWSILYNEKSGDGRWTINFNGDKTNSIIYYNPVYAKSIVQEAVTNLIKLNTRKRGRPRKS